MENSYLRKNQLLSLLTRRGVMLDENYVLRGRELLGIAQDSLRKVPTIHVYSDEEQEEDELKAARLKPKPFTLIRIIAYSFYVLGLLSLLLPIDPFMSRLPICGVFVGLGGILYFSYLLGSNKRKENASAYYAILRKYDVDDEQDIASVQQERRELASAARDAEARVLQFIRFADDKVSSLDECNDLLNRLEIIIREYRSL